MEFHGNVNGYSVSAVSFGDPVCHRCLKPIGVELGFVRTFMNRLILSGANAGYVRHCYHKKCLPPVLFHKVSGSHPEGADRQPQSPSQEHAGRRIGA